MLPSAAGMISILNADSETFDLAPRWIAFSAITMFFNCGIVVGLMDSGFNEYRKPGGYHLFMAWRGYPSH